MAVEGCMSLERRQVTRGHEVRRRVGGHGRRRQGEPHNSRSHTTWRETRAAADASARTRLFTRSSFPAFLYTKLLRMRRSNHDADCLPPSYRSFSLHASSVSLSLSLSIYRFIVTKDPRKRYRLPSRFDARIVFAVSETCVLIGLRKSSGYSST